jgi:endonuclease I
MSRFFIIFFFTASLLLGQSNWNAITVSDTVVDFGRTTAYDSHSQTLTLFNHLDSTIHVSGAYFDEDEFYTDLQPLDIPANGQYDFHIYLKTGQNVNYTDFLRIETNAGIHPLVVQTSAQVEYTDSYYDATQNKWGADLKAALHNIIKGHTQYGYGDLWDILSDTDEDPNNPNNVILIYTGWSYPKSDHGGDPDQWNREHVWAKSHGDFGTTPPAGTDVHHIRPCDVSVNSKRGNLDFDNGGTEYVDPDGDTGCHYDSDSWEPRDEDKGDVARMMYYMVVRYEGEEGYDLELVDYTPSTTGNDPVFGKQSTLYQWNWMDSVDNWERRRNDRIYNNWQHNRNPFIDHPEFVDRLPSVSGMPLYDDPEIAVAPHEANMGTIGFNSTAHYYLAIINTGNENLNVSQIKSTNPAFTVDQTSLTLVPETYDYVEVSFTSQSAEGTFSTTIQITSNDPDEGEIEVPVRVTVSGSTSSARHASPLAASYRLYQNYPNPFNPNTIIRYQLPVRERVVLDVFDPLGKKVAQLVNGLQGPGEYQVVFRAAHLPNGVYFYRLQTRHFRQIRKMVLLK